MNAITGWRVIGAAMRWARHHQGITIDRTVMDAAPWGHMVDHRWRYGDATVIVSFATWQPKTSITIRAAGGYVELNGVDAGIKTVLRVLAAFGLIPDLFADLQAARLRNCARCDQLVQFVSGEQMWPDRWVHDDLVLWAENGRHRAEVAQ